jgi:hypothetical protein
MPSKVTGRQGFLRQGRTMHDDALGLSADIVRGAKMLNDSKVGGI